MCFFSLLDFPHSFGDDYERPGPKRPKFQYFVQNITEELDSTATLACQIRDLGTIQVSEDVLYIKRTSKFSGNYHL